MPTQLLLAALLLGQASTASVHGTVRDSETGTPVQGASVELLDGDARSLSDDAGHYELARASPGPRHLKVSALGYRSRTLHVFVPATGGIRVDVALLPEPIPIEPVDASIEREGPGSLDLRPGEPGLRVGSRTVTHLDVSTDPGLAEPDFFEALGGASGVRIDPETPNALHVHGGSADQNLFTLDGIPIFSPYHATGQFSALSADAIGRVDLHAGVPPATWDGALSSIVDVRARSPSSERLGLRGAVTPSSARITADGPAGLDGGVLVSGGWGRPGFLAPPRESSYLRGSFAHGLAKGEWPLGDGRVEIVGFHGDNALRMASQPADDGEGDAGTETSAAARPEADGGPHRFSWRSTSYGLVWEEPIDEGITLDARVWYADLDVASDWWEGESPMSVSGRRSAVGSRLRLAIGAAETRSIVGVSLERERTDYAVRPLGSTSAAEPTVGFGLSAEPTVLGAFLEHERVLTERVQASLGLRGNGVLGDGLYLAPRASLRWVLSPSVAASAGYARTYQWVQSLRNSESLIANLFSPDLPVAVGADGMPVARADQVTVALDARPASGVTLGLEAYARALDGLILVAPTTGLPFAVEDLQVGSGETWGLGVNLDVRRERYRALASYGFGSVRNELHDLEYAPGFAIEHAIAAGVAYYPTAQLELRTAVRAEVGRPRTLVEGPISWEACSIIEGGCEAEGSPRRMAGPLGEDRLPPYVRVDVGIRKHWHSRILGRSGLVAVFATVTNVFGRRNVLGYISDPDTGELSMLPMRSFSPLTAGLEWQF